jgi:hypothetical protein
VAPEACTLPRAEQPLRAAEFDDLFERHCVRVEHQGPTKATLVLSGSEGLAGLVRDLAAREALCCSFFDFTVSELPGERAGRVVVHLDVEVPPTRADVLSALVARAKSASRGGANAR